jgi:uncharacterized membrane protein
MLKIITAILLTFVLAFATTLLFELEFITKNYWRIILVSLIIILELIIGYMYVKSEILKNSKTEN